MCTGFRRSFEGTGPRLKAFGSLLFHAGHRFVHGFMLRGLSMTGGVSFNAGRSDGRMMMSAEGAGKDTGPAAHEEREEHDAAI